MYICVRSCIHTSCMSACMNACMHSRMHSCMHVCKSACVHTCIPATCPGEVFLASHSSLQDHLFRQIRGGGSSRALKCTHVCMNVCTHACMHACQELLAINVDDSASDLCSAITRLAPKFAAQELIILEFHDLERHHPDKRAALDMRRLHLKEQTGGWWQFERVKSMHT